MTSKDGRHVVISIDQLTPDRFMLARH
ncbi:MAG: hypothetical protein AVDCRST_MAG93-8627, partial [uncultured Chloroflexia bacterium]